VFTVLSAYVGTLGGGTTAAPGCMPLGRRVVLVEVDIDGSNRTFLARELGSAGIGEVGGGSALGNSGTGGGGDSLESGANQEGMGRWLASNLAGESLCG
jgi:hypothetical protein